MSDITTVWRTDEGRGGWVVQGAGLRQGNDLATAVLNSLFSDQRAEADDVLLDGSDDRRGWWADEALGSRLWLLERAKENSETLLRAKDYTTQSLQWLVDDGIASAVEVSVTWVRRFMLGIEVVIKKSNGARQSLRFEWAWKGLA